MPDPSAPSALYRPSLALLTDFYELTMAAAAWKSGAAKRHATFTLSFRRHPFQGGFTVAAGHAPAMDLLDHLRIDP
jgi:nicotinate phosphoribosyltransferase